MHKRLKRVKSEIKTIQGAVLGTYEPLFYVAAPGAGIEVFEALINALARAGVRSEILLDVKNGNAVIRFGITMKEKQIVKNFK